jgi:hypothetical protein
MDITFRQSPNYSGNMGAKSVIVIHWWGNPADKPSLSGTVNWLCNPAAKVSAHYVVSGKSVYQLVREEHVAWHAMQANPFSIGIEVDPNTPPGTYETVIQLCREIVERHRMNRSSCIKRHKDYVNTACPGTLDIERIRQGVATQGEPDMTIFIRPISMLKVKLKKPVRLYNIETGLSLWDSGDYMEVTGKTNIVRGVTYLIPIDRMQSGEPFGFLEHEVLDGKNEVHDTQFDPPKFDDFRAMLTYYQATGHPQAEEVSRNHVAAGTTFAAVMQADMAWYQEKLRLLDELLKKDTPAPLSEDDKKNMTLGAQLRALLKEAA